MLFTSHLILHPRRGLNRSKLTLELTNSLVKLSENHTLLNENFVQKKVDLLNVPTEQAKENKHNWL